MFGSNMKSLMEIMRKCDHGSEVKEVRADIDSSLRDAFGEDGVVSREAITYEDGCAIYTPWSGSEWALKMLGYNPQSASVPDTERDLAAVAFLREQMGETDVLLRDYGVYRVSSWADLRDIVSMLERKKSGL